MEVWCSSERADRIEAEQARLREMIEIIVESGIYLGDMAKRRRAYDLGFGDKPMDRSDGG